MLANKIRSLVDNREYWKEEVLPLLDKCLDLYQDDVFQSRFETMKYKVSTEMVKPVINNLNVMNMIYMNADVISKDSYYTNNITNKNMNKEVEKNLRELGSKLMTMYNSLRFSKQEVVEEEKVIVKDIPNNPHSIDSYKEFYNIK